MLRNINVNTVIKLRKIPIMSRWKLGLRSLRRVKPTVHIFNYVSCACNATMTLPPDRITTTWNDWMAVERSFTVVFAIAVAAVQRNSFMTLYGICVRRMEGERKTASQHSLWRARVDRRQGYWLSLQTSQCTKTKRTLTLGRLVFGKRLPPPHLDNSFFWIRPRLPVLKVESLSGWYDKFHNYLLRLLLLAITVF